MRAVLAAINPAAGVVVDTVADDAAVAVRAARRELFDCALEAVEHMRGPFGRLHREGFLVAVAADFTGTHDSSFQAARRFRPCAARFAGFFSMLFFKSDMRSMTSPRFESRAPF